MALDPYILNPTPCNPQRTALNQRVEPFLPRTFPASLLPFPSPLPPPPSSTYRTTVVYEYIPHQGVEKDTGYMYFYIYTCKYTHIYTCMYLYIYTYTCTCTLQAHIHCMYMYITCTCTCTHAYTRHMKIPQEGAGNDDTVPRAAWLHVHDDVHML